MRIYFPDILYISVLRKIEAGYFWFLENYEISYHTTCHHKYIKILDKIALKYILIYYFSTFPITQITVIAKLSPHGPGRNRRSGTQGAAPAPTNGTCAEAGQQSSFPLCPLPTSPGLFLYVPGINCQPLVGSKTSTD